ncbi:unnamed protein product [Didymodactylos carnosus]|uniref:Uncharacterized protein n=1 Tax=Didymodactylos carnosus TaxID=1234261 RepID=A0A814F358_9BILA|nr:unnamed protein product [Didymodactylos carnosus]CAF0977464.1 unnamed protein product [Didymodactylos carnosus]CAF3635939.1 unnamed protein product [Didymodactylos carnosus]CAF3750307.1 unnamed protein product [Didymodactylos carnosus]
MTTTTFSFIESQLHDVIRSQQATIDQLTAELEFKKNYVPLEQYEDALLKLESSAKTEIELKDKLNDMNLKLNETFVILNDVCKKIDSERQIFNNLLLNIKKTTVNEMKKNTELFTKTLQIENEYVEQRQLLETKNCELKQLTNKMKSNDKKLSYTINKLEVKLEQEKFITREISKNKFK